MASDEKNHNISLNPIIIIPYNVPLPIEENGLPSTDYPPWGVASRVGVDVACRKQCHLRAKCTLPNVPY